MLERERLAAGVPLLKSLSDFDRFRVTEVSGCPCTLQQSYFPATVARVCGKGTRGGGVCVREGYARRRRVCAGRVRAAAACVCGKGTRGGGVCVREGYARRRRVCAGRVRAAAACVCGKGTRGGGVCAWEEPHRGVCGKGTPIHNRNKADVGYERI
jgi:hypothetical protein